VVVVWLVCHHQLAVNLSHGHVVTRSSRHQSTRHMRLVTQSTRHKRAHNKTTITSRNYLQAVRRYPETVLNTDGVITTICVTLMYTAAYRSQRQITLELELDASADPSHPTDDNGEESYSLYISPFVP